MDTTRESLECAQYLTFRIRDAEYAIGLLRVREILEFTAVTAVPLVPPWIRGVINLRGTVVPVVDLAVKLGLEATAVTSRTCIVIVETDLEGEIVLMGVMADSVSQVVELADDQIEDPPAFGTQVHVDYLRGMGTIDDRLALILDVESALASRELLAAVQDAEGATGEANAA